MNASDEQTIRDLLSRGCLITVEQARALLGQVDDARRLLRGAHAEFVDHAGKCRGMDELRSQIHVHLRGGS